MRQIRPHRERGGRGRRSARLGRFPHLLTVPGDSPSGYPGSWLDAVSADSGTLLFSQTDNGDGLSAQYYYSSGRGFTAGPTVGSAACWVALWGNGDGNLQISATFSANGRYVACDTGTDAADTAYLVDTETGDIQKIQAGVDDLQVFWVSDDGQQVIYRQSDVDEQWTRTP